MTNLATDAVASHSAVLSSAPSSQRLCVTWQWAVTERRSRSTLAVGTPIDSRLLSTQAAGTVTFISCQWAQRPASPQAVNVDGESGHKGTKFLSERARHGLPSQQAASSRLSLWTSTAPVLPGGQNWRGNVEFKTRTRALECGIWNLGHMAGDEATSIPSALRSLKVRRDSGCVTPSAARPLPTPLPGLAQPAQA